MRHFLKYRFSKICLYIHIAKYNVFCVCQRVYVRVYECHICVCAGVYVLVCVGYNDAR